MRLLPIREQLLHFESQFHEIVVSFGDNGVGLVDIDCHFEEADIDSVGFVDLKLLVELYVKTV